MEDNILFKTHVVQDLPTYREFNQGYSHSTPTFSISRIFTILCTIYFCTLMDSLVAVYGFLIVLAMWGVIGLIQWLANRGGGVHYKRMLSANFGKPQTQDFHFTDTAIIPVNEAQTLPGGILYNQVKRVVETKSLLLLVLPYRQAVLVSKANLEGGTQEEFLTFLRGKCVRWKSGKVSKGKLGKVLNWIWAVCLVITAVAAICNFPGIEVAKRLDGAVINTMDYEEVAEKLEPLGITGFDEIMYEDLDYYYSEYYTGLDYGYFHKSADLLVWVGMGDYDEDAGTWTPSANGVFAPDYEPWTQETMYTDFLRGISAMDPDTLEITDITEDISGLDEKEWRGVITLSFTLDGQPHELRLNSPGPWLDETAMMQIADVINALDGSRQLYFADDEGSGLLIFYRDEAWAVEFMRITVIPLFTDPEMIYTY